MSNEKAKPMPKPTPTKAPHRIRILLTAAGIMVENPMPGVEIEVRDYHDDFADEEGHGRDSDGDYFAHTLFDDKGEPVIGAEPPNEYVQRQ